MTKGTPQTLPGLEPKPKTPRRGRLSRAVDQIIRDSRAGHGPLAIDNFTAAMLREAVANVERAIAEGSSWAVANAQKELRALRTELLRPDVRGGGDAFDQLLQDLAADITT